MSSTEAFSLLPKDNLTETRSLSFSARTYSDTTKVPSDSLRKKKQDSLQVKRQKEKDGIKTTVNYTSEDSILFDTETQTMKLFGDSKIAYGDMNLKAEQIDINWRTNNVEARGVPDSTGKLKGNPLFQEKQDQYQTKKIRYNFKTKKGIISEVITKQGDGFIHGERVKKNEENELFAQHSQYTTCNLAEPHFSISSTKIKVIPQKKIISGPFNLVLNKVPTPLGFLFGFFPAPKTRASGFIIPTYGEQQNRGFYLSGGGFYWAVSNYIGMKFTADIYSLGGAGAQQTTDYRKRYQYNGLFNFQYTWLKTYSPADLTKTLNTHNFWIKWNHTTLSKKPGRLTISISAGSNAFNQQNPQIQPASQALAPSFQSSISYSRSFPKTPFNLTMNLREDQTTRGVKNFTLPDMSVNMNRVMPFQNIKGGKSTEALRKFNISYTLNLQNRITNDSNVIGYKTVDSSGFPLRRMYNYSDDIDYLFSSKNLNNGASHSIPISTTFKVLKYFSLNPRFTFTEYWYNRAYNYGIDTVHRVNQKDTLMLRKDTVAGFRRTDQYNFSTGLTTRIYGTFFLKIGRLEALRHTLIPTVTYSYNPDFTDPKLGNYQRVAALDQPNVYNAYNTYQGGIVGSPNLGKSSSLLLDLKNTFELKVRNKSDTATGKNKYQKVKLLDNLQANGGYNFAVDSFNLSIVNIAARTKLFNLFDVAYSSRLDPYDRRNDTNRVTNAVTSKRINQLQWEHGKGPGNIISSFLAFSFSLSSQKFKKTKKEDLKTRADKMTGKGTDEQELQKIKNNPNEYLDFTIPWNMNVAYNLTYTQNYVPGAAPDTYLHSISLSGDMSFSEKWKVQITTGYSLNQKNITYTQIGVTRDLHCWVMALNWVPPIPNAANTGSYNFRINVKASALQDLKITKNRTWTDITQ